MKNKSFAKKIIFTYLNYRSYSKKVGVLAQISDNVI